MNRWKPDDVCVGLVTYISTRPDGSKTVVEIKRDDPDEERQIAERLLKSLGSNDNARSSRSSGRFPTPEGCNWEDVTISFYSNEEVKITAKGTVRKYTFAEMGFKDGRKGDVPDSLWGLLREGFARHGEISWDNGRLTINQQNNLKAKVKDIRKRLKEFFGINDDPFHPYRQKKAYAPRFGIFDLREGTADAPIQTAPAKSLPRPDPNDLAGWQALLDAECPLDQAEEYIDEGTHETSDEKEDRYDDLDFR